MFRKMIRSNIAHLEIHWNLRGQLIQIEWCRKVSDMPSREHTLPKSLDYFLERLQNYLMSGAPLPKIDWSWMSSDSMSNFQRRVYESVQEIPHGETRSYSWVANRMSEPNAARAVGQALRKNPFLVLVPCHRVISLRGDLGGFMGASDGMSDELMFKRRLLQLESGYRNPMFSFVNDIDGLRSVDFSSSEPTSQTTNPSLRLGSVLSI